MFTLLMLRVDTRATPMSAMALRLWRDGAGCYMRERAGC